MEAAVKVATIVTGLIKDQIEEQEAAERQAQIMSALDNIQQSINSLQIEVQVQTDIERASPSFTDISVWQNLFPSAVKNNDTAKIKSLLETFNSSGTDGAAFHIQNIFNVLTGQGVGPGVVSVLQSWHQISYQKMYTAEPGSGLYTFTLKDYLNDYDAILSWAIGLAGYALACEIIALQDLADTKTTTPEEISNEAKRMKNDFFTNVDTVLDVAYDQFPPFVKKFKPSYDTTVTNTGQWFRLWRNNSHVKNFVGWNNDGLFVLENDADVGSDNESMAVFQIYPIACDDSEGIYPEVEFRFDQNNHPLNGLATLISRMNGDTVSFYIFEGRTDGLDDSPNSRGKNGVGFTTTTDPSYWMSGVSFATATFNVLPVSTDVSQTNAPAFVLMPANIPWLELEWSAQWIPGTASPLGYWILRDDGLQQTNWVKTPESDSRVPNEPSRAPSPNPTDNGHNQTTWEVYAKYD